MAFDSTPWAIGGGAEHSTDVARTLAYNAANGNEGVVAATDLEVRELNVPGTSVRVLAGSCNVLNRTSGYRGQMYTGRAPSETEVPISATGSGAGRSDLIVVRVEDPTVDAQWDTPADPTAADYIFARVISNVPSGTETVAELGLGFSAIALARVDLPASTGTITQAMITDLRTVANPRSWRRLFTLSGVTADAEWLRTPNAPGEYFPDVARWDMTVPEWATSVNVVGTWAGVRCPNAQVIGRLWVGGGDVAQTAPNTVITQEVGFDTSNTGGVQRWAFTASGTLTLPSSMRGGVRRFGLRGRNTDAPAGEPADSNRIKFDSLSSVVLDIEFLEVPTSNV